MTDGRDETEPDASATVTPRRRKPWVAGILSFLMPGLGHQYIGLYLHAVLLFVLFRVADLTALILIAVIPVRLANVVVPVTLTLGLRTFLAAVAARDARRMATDRPVGRLSRWYSLIAAVVFVAATIHPLSMYVCKKTLVETYVIPTRSMENTILRGDRLVAVKWAYGWRMPFSEGTVLGLRIPLIVIAEPGGRDH